MKDEIVIEADDELKRSVVLTPEQEKINKQIFEEVKVELAYLFED